MKSIWPTKKLSEIREEVKLEKAPVGVVPYIEIGSVDVNSKKVIFSDKGAVKGSVVCPENSILISRVRPTRGAVVLVDKKYTVSSAFTIIKPKFNPRLLFYFLTWNKTFFEYLGNQQKGTSYPSVRESDILNFRISFPENPDVQQKIVRVLDVVQEGVEAQEKIIGLARELKKSLMAKLFREGTREAKLKKTEIGEIPENWEVVKVKNLGTVITGTTPSTYIPEYWHGNIPFVTPSDFDEKIYIYQTERKVSEEGARKGKILPKNSVLVVCIGSTLGKITLSYDKCITNQQINAIICDSSKVDPFFVYYYLFKNKNLLKSYAGTTAKPIVKKSLFEIFPIPLPSLPKQREIAEILQTVDQKIEIEQKKKALYEELFKTMLNQIMAQKIDVDKLKL